MPARTVPVTRRSRGVKRDATLTPELAGRLQVTVERKQTLQQTSEDSKHLLAPMCL